MSQKNKVELPYLRTMLVMRPWNQQFSGNEWLQKRHVETRLKGTKKRRGGFREFTKETWILGNLQMRFSRVLPNLSGKKILNVDIFYGRTRSNKNWGQPFFLSPERKKLRRKIQTSKKNQLEPKTSDFIPRKWRRKNICFRQIAHKTRHYVQEAAWTVVDFFCWFPLKKTGIL